MSNIYEGRGLRWDWETMTVHILADGRVFPLKWSDNNNTMNYLEDSQWHIVNDMYLKEIQHYKDYLVECVLLGE